VGPPIVVVVHGEEEAEKVVLGVMAEELELDGAAKN
jgi:hypothetical protein